MCIDRMSVEDLEKNRYGLEIARLQVSFLLPPSLSLA